MKMKRNKMNKSKKNKKIQKKLITRRSILKGTKTAWIFFCDENRKKVLKENPNLAFGEVCRKLAPMWNNLSDDEKKPYIEKHLEDKLRYETKLKNLTDEERKHLRRYRRYKRSLKKNKPKSALSPYMFFVIEKRADVVNEQPNADFKTIGKILGDRWNKMTNSEKEVYFEKSRIDKDRYIREKTIHSNEQNLKRKK